MTTSLNPLAVRAGDVVLVFTREKGSNLTRFGQNLLRLRSIVSGRSQGARYSHVMLGIAPGIVIHADGKSVEIQPLEDAIGKHLDPNRFRAVRFVSPPLDQGAREKVVQEAVQFYKQKYSFVPGRRSSWLGRLLHRGRSRTMPFCSELVATAYGALGIRIADRPYDRTLPLDLEVSCTPPRWQDVSAEFEATPLPGSFGSEPIQVGDRTITMEEFFAETDRLMHRTRTQHAKQAEATQAHVKTMIEGEMALQEWTAKEMALSKEYSATPQRLLQVGDTLVRADLGSLPGFYERIRSGIQVEGRSTAEGIHALFPGLDPGKAPYEGFPTIELLRRYELTGASTAFAAKALRLQAELLGIAKGLGLWSEEDAHFDGLSEALVLPYLAAIPRFEGDVKHEIDQAIERLVLPGMDDQTTQQVRDICRVIVTAHAALSRYRFQGEAATKP